MVSRETGHRVFLRARLTQGSVIDLDRNQTNYLVNVLRLVPGDAIRVFNGQQGEWGAVLVERGRRAFGLAIDGQEREQDPAPDLYYLFAPLKQGRLDYMVQKAVEMGAGLLAPVITQHTQINRVNIERMEANAIEAAEQCGLVTIPRMNEPIALGELLDGWPSAESDRRIVYCDEAAPPGDPIKVLGAHIGGRFAVLVGPEGGFSEQERQLLRSKPFVTAIRLGPRVLRADTAAVAAMALVQAVLGDWSDVRNLS